MGIFKDIRQDVGELRIAVPDDKKDQILYKWPQASIRRYSKAIVDADEVALFVSQGQVLGQLPPGQHVIDAQELPVLGVFIDRLFYDNAYRAELFFCKTTETRDLTFGGRFADLREPDFGLLVEVRCYGDYALQVLDPGLLVTKIGGTVDRPDNDFVTDYVGRRLLQKMKERVLEGLLAKSFPVLGIGAYASEIEQATLQSLNPELAETGLSVIRFGEFDINIDDRSRERLEQKTDKMADIGMAGNPNYQAYAQGQVLEGAGQGLAQGGAANQTAFLGLGLGVAGGVAGPFQQGMQPGAAGPAGGTVGGGGGGAPSPQGGAGAGATVACPSCHMANTAGAKFCASCGASLAPATVACPSCGAQNAATAKFCAQCGTALAKKPAATCASCGTELAEGVKFCPSCGTAVAAPAPAATSGSIPPAGGGGGGEGPTSEA